MFIFYLHHEIQALLQHTRGWYLEMWKAIQKFYRASIAYYMEWGLFVDLLSPEECLQIPWQRFFLLFWCVLAFPSAGYPLCLSSRMRECRCSWELLCVDLLEARCWEKRRSSKGDLRARGRKAAREGFPSYGDINRSLDNNVTSFDGNGHLLSQRRSILVLFQIFNIPIRPLQWHSWIFRLSHRGPEIAIQCVRLVSVFKNEITKTFLGVEDAGDLEIGKRKPDFTEQVKWMDNDKI